MRRVVRIYIEEGVFHVLTRGNNKQWIFKDDANFKVYREGIDMNKSSLSPFSFNLYHFMHGSQRED